MLSLAELGLTNDPATDAPAGQLVVGEIHAIEELTGFKKPIRYAQVNTGEEKHRGIVCAATNFAEGDRVVVALPGTSFPGGITIAERITYGRLSEGMMCSPRELGVSDDHSTILVLPPGIAATPGEDICP